MANIVRVTATDGTPLEFYDEVKSSGGMKDCYFSTDYKTKNIDAIKKKADELLRKDCKADILSRMDKEALSFEPFAEALRLDLGERYKETKDD